MATTAVLRYRCRRCDAEETRGSYDTSLAENIVVRLAITGLYDTSRLHEVHDCGDGGYGVLELLGSELQES